MAVDYLNQYGLSDGLFLVRMSGRSQGCHALSVVVRNQIYHYEIQVKVTTSLIVNCFQQTDYAIVRTRVGTTLMMDPCFDLLSM